LGTVAGADAQAATAKAKAAETISATLFTGQSPVAGAFSGDQSRDVAV
jgi:hypothetical protein